MARINILAQTVLEELLIRVKILLEKNFLNLVLASGTYFKTQKKSKQIAIIAKDTRLSGYTLEPALVSGLVHRVECMFLHLGPLANQWT